jgi:hypothetical protein
MPIRFACEQCAQLLSIARRKAGTSIECPKCGHLQMVPDEQNGEPPSPSETTPTVSSDTEELPIVSPVIVRDTVSAGADEDELEIVSGAAEPLVEPIPESTDDAAAESDIEPLVEPIDDAALDSVVEEVLDSSGGKSFADSEPTPESVEPPAAAPELPPAPPADEVDEEAEPDNARSQPSQEPAPPAVPSSVLVGEMVLISRRTLYLQAGLIAVVGVVAMLAGYWIGRGAAPDGAAAESEAAEASQVVIDGKLLRRLVDRIDGDENAVALFLPANKTPEEPIETAGIRPTDRPGSGYSVLQQIREFGGGYARADATGYFMVNLPAQGKYYVLFISANNARPDGVKASELDLSTLDDYLRRPEYLIGKQKYRLTLETLDGYKAIDHDFGLSRDM